MNIMKITRETTGSTPSLEQLRQALSDAPTLAPTPTAPVVMQTPLLFTDDPSKFTDNQLEQLITWVAHGRTLRWIQSCATKEDYAWKMLPTLKCILALHNSPDYSQRLLARRQEGDTPVLRFGLARREERIKRLTGLAERYEAILQVDDEGKPLDSPINLKIAVEYRKVIAELRTETEPLHVKMTVTEDDPWMELLQKLAQSKASRQSKQPQPQQQQIASSEMLLISP